MRKCSGRSLWCAGRLRVSGRLLWGRRQGRLLVWERNRGNGEPWVYGRRPKQMGRGVGLKMSVAGGCWFSQRVGGWRKEGTTFVGCWMEKRKACAGSRERKSKAGRAALFFFFSKGGSDQKRKMKRVQGFFFVFGSSFLKNYPLLNIFSPVYMVESSLIQKISIYAIQRNITIIITEIVFYNQHQQILYIWYFILQ